jgi:hypothetical protein
MAGHNRRPLQPLAVVVVVDRVSAHNQPLGRTAPIPTDNGQIRQQHKKIYE